MFKSIVLVLAAFFATTVSANVIEYEGDDNIKQFLDQQIHSCAWLMVRKVRLETEGDIEDLVVKVRSSQLFLRDRTYLEPAASIDASFTINNKPGRAVCILNIDGPLDADIMYDGNHWIWDDFYRNWRPART